MQTQQNTAERPWYKQFWPWFVFLIPASGVVAGIATVIIATQHAPQTTQSNISKFARVIEHDQSTPE